MAFDAGAIESRLTLDRQQFNRELDAARADAERFANSDFSAKAGVNATDAQRTVDEVRAGLDQLSRDRADPSVHLSDEEFLAKLAELKAKLHELGDEHIDVPTDKAQEHLKGLKDKADEAKGSAGGGGLGGLATAAISLGPAIVPVLGVTAAGIGLLAAPLTAATLGFGSLGLVALPVISDVKNAMQQLASGRVTLQQLPPDIASVVSGIRGFRNEWGLLASKLQPDILGVMNTGIGVMRSLLPQLIAPAHQAALALGDIGQRAQTALAGPAWHGWVTEMTSQVRPAIDSIIRSFANLGAGLGGLLNAFMPFVGSFEAGMVRVTNAFRLWGENLGTSQGFQSFMQWVKDNAHVVGDTLKQLGAAFVNLSSALSGLGGIELRVIDGLLAFVNALLKIPVLGPVIADIGFLIFTVAKLAPAFEAAGAALVAFSAKTDVLLATRIGVFFTDAAAGLGIFVQGISLAGAATLSFEALLGPLGIALAALAAGYGYLVAQQAGATKQGQDVANAMDSQSQAALHSANSQADYQDAINQSKAALTAFTHDFDTHGRSVSENDAITKQLNDTWQQTVKQANNATAALRLIDTQLGLTDQQTQALARSQNVDLTKTAPAEALQRLRAALQADADQAGLTTTAFAELAAGAGKSTSDVAKAVAAATDATDKAFKQATDITKTFANQTLPVSGLQITEFYAKHVKDAQDFSTNINKAIQAGYDPQLISRILQQGPAQAGPLLQGLVSNSSTAFVTMVNNAEQQLAQLDQKVVEMQRLTTLAVQADNNQKTQDLKAAMQADQIILAQGGTASVTALADNLHMGIPQLLAVLHEFGIHFTLSSEDIARISAKGGADAAQGIATALANGQQLNQQQLDLLKQAFGDTAANVATAGHNAGAGFANGLTNEMRDRLAALGVVMSAYDATIQGGVNPILSTVGGQQVNLSPQQSHDIIGLPGKATGGMLVNHPMFVVGEQAPVHPEVVISTNPAYRTKNLGLLATAGKMMGLQAGGFMDPSQVPAPNDPAFFAYGTGSSFGGGTDGIAHIVFDATKAFVQKQADARAAAAAAAISSAGGGPFAGGPIKDYMLGEVAKRWPGAAEAAAFDFVEGNEAGYNPNAANPSSNARGLAQNIAGWGPDYQPGNVQQQTAWMLSYISSRYGDPIGAMNFWKAHHWYGDGGIFTQPSIIGVGEKGPEAVVPLGRGGAFGGPVTIHAPFINQGTITKEALPGMQKALDQHYGKMMAELRGHGVITPPGGRLG